MKLLEYRLRPKRDYLMIAPWEELASLTEYWKDELVFYQEELQFFENLLTIYEDLNPEPAELKQLINDTRIQLHSLMIQVDQHLAHLGKIIKETDNSDDLLFRQEHNVLEDNISAFIGSFRQIKQKLFKTVAKKIPLPNYNNK